MRSSAKEAPTARSPKFGSLPRRLRVLFVTSYHRTGNWLAEAFANDSAVEVSLDDVVGAAAGLERLRDEVFDAVLVTHEPEEIDALEFIEGLRAGGADEPVIVLGSQSEQELAPLAFEVGADAYLCVHTATTRLLIWKVSRACERHHLLRENQRLTQADKQRLHQEHQEAQRLLDEQRNLLRDLEAFAPATVDNSNDNSPSSAIRSTLVHSAARVALSSQLPPALVNHYRELLRAYVMMGSGNLGSEMSTLADLLAGGGMSTAETMQLHLQVAEEMVRGLGSRSARHVMTRADLLILEVMVHLGEVYRTRYLERRHPARQRMLPGFDNATPSALSP